MPVFKMNSVENQATAFCACVFFCCWVFSLWIKAESTCSFLGKYDDTHTKCFMMTFPATASCKSFTLVKETHPYYWYLALRRDEMIPFLVSLSGPNKDQLPSSFWTNLQPVCCPLFVLNSSWETYNYRGVFFFCHLCLYGFLSFLCVRSH